MVLLGLSLSLDIRLLRVVDGIYDWIYVRSGSESSCWSVMIRAVQWLPGLRTSYTSACIELRDGWNECWHEHCWRHAIGRKDPRIMTLSMLNGPIYPVVDAPQRGSAKCSSLKGKKSPKIHKHPSLSLSIVFSFYPLHMIDTHAALGVSMSSCRSKCVLSMWKPSSKQLDLKIT